MANISNNDRNLAEYKDLDEIDASVDQAQLTLLDRGAEEKIIYTHCRYCGKPISKERQRYYAQFCPRLTTSCYAEFMKEQAEREAILHRKERRNTLADQTQKWAGKHPDIFLKIFQRIEYAQERGIHGRLTMYWIMNDIRQFDGIPFRNEFIPYLTREVLKRRPDLIPLFETRE